MLAMRAASCFCEGVSIVVMLLVLIIYCDISGGTVYTAPPNHLTTRAPPARRCCDAPRVGGDWRTVGIYGLIAIVLFGA